MLAPSAEGHCQTSASRRCCEVPEAATGRCAYRAPAYEHIRNGTSSSANPQHANTVVVVAAPTL